MSREFEYFGTFFFFFFRPLSLLLFYFIFISQRRPPAAAPNRTCGRFLRAKALYNSSTISTAVLGRSVLSACIRSLPILRTLVGCILCCRCTSATDWASSAAVRAILGAERGWARALLLLVGGGEHGGAPSSVEPSGTGGRGVS